MPNPLTDGIQPTGPFRICTGGGPNETLLPDRESAARERKTDTAGRYARFFDEPPHLDPGLTGTVFANSKDDGHGTGSYAVDEEAAARKTGHRGGRKAMKKPVMTTIEDTALVTARTEREELAENWRILLTLGIVTAAIGAAAIALPRAATLAVELVLGCLLILDAVVQGIHAGQLRGTRRFGWKVAASLLSLGAGVLLLAFPMAGILSLTLVVAVFFLMAAFLKGILALSWRPGAGWGGLLLSAAISLLLGLSILLAFPAAAAWVVGLLVGITRLVDGVWLIGMALSARAGARL